MAVLEEAADEPQQPSLVEGPLNDLLKTAVDAEHAITSQRRKVFDAAPDFMRRTLIFSSEPDIQAVRKTSFETAFNLAVSYKEKGNALYKEGRDKEALDEYSRAISIFRHFKRDGDDFIMVLQDEDSLAAEEKQSMHDVLLGCFLNVAACLLRNKQAPEAVFACQEALRIDSQSVKALFRRAMAFIQMDLEASLDAAETDLVLAVRLAPSSPEIKAALKRCRELKSERDKKAKETYAGMFDKGKLYDDKVFGKGGPPKVPGLPGEVSERGKTERIEIDAEAFLKEGAAAGVDMNAPWAKKRLKELQEKARKNKPGADSATRGGRWGKALAFAKRAADKRYWISIPTLLYAIIFINIAVRSFEFLQLMYYWIKDRS